MAAVVGFAGRAQALDDVEQAVGPAHLPALFSIFSLLTQRCQEGVPIRTVDALSPEIAHADELDTRRTRWPP